MRPGAAATNAAPASSDTQVVVGLIRRHPLSIAIPLAAMVALIAVGVWRMRVPPATPAATASALPLPIEQVTFSGNVGLGALSPDGKFVAYAKKDQAGFTIWVRQMSGQSDVQIVGNAPGRRVIALVVTPDGGFVDYAATELDQREPTLWRVPFLGGTPRRIARDVWSATGWSPDAKHFAFVRSRPGAQVESIVIADSDGGNERVLAQRQAPRRFMSVRSNRAINHPSWSADGKTVMVLGRGLPGPGVRAGELVLLDAVSGAEQKVVPVDGTLIDSALVDDTHAIVNHVRTGELQATLSLVDINTGAVVALSPQFIEFIGVSLTADRRAAVTMRLDSRAGVWIGDEAGATLREVVPESGGSPNSAKIDNHGGIVFGLYGKDGWALHSLAPGAQTPTLILAGATEPDLSADGRTVVFHRPAPHLGLWRANIDGSGLTQLADGQNGSYPLIEERTKTVLYSSTKNGNLQTLWSAPLGGGPGHEILHRLVTDGSVSISPDGKRVLFGSDIVDTRRTQVECDLPDCTNQRTLSVGGTRWAPDGKSVAFVDPRNFRTIVTQRLEGGPVTPLTHFEDKTSVDSFDWSPDLKRMVLVRGNVTADLVQIDLRPAGSK